MATGSGGAEHFGGAGGNGGKPGKVGHGGDASFTMEGTLCTPVLTITGKAGNVNVSIGALFAEENTTVNLTALAPDDTGKVAEMSVSIGTLYVEGKTTLNLSGMPEGSVVIDRVVMPANSLLTITRNGRGQGHDPRALYHAVLPDYRHGSCCAHKRRDGL